MLENLPFKKGKKYIKDIKKPTAYSDDFFFRYRLFANYISVWMSCYFWKLNQHKAEIIISEVKQFIFNK